MDIWYFPLWQMWGLISGHSDILCVYVTMTGGSFLKWRLNQGSVIATIETYSRCYFACWKCHKLSPQSQKTFSLTVRRTCVWPLCHISESVKMAPWLQLNGVESSWSESSREFRWGPLPLRSIVVSRDLLPFNKSVILLRRWEQMHTEEAGETRECLR